MLLNCTGALCTRTTCMPPKDQHGTALDTKERAKYAYDATLAAIFIVKSNPRRYGDLVTKLTNKFALDTNQYPTTLKKAYSLLCDYTTKRQLSNTLMPESNTDAYS